MLEAEALKLATAKLLFESLTQEDRDELLTKALASLLEPQRGQYNNGKSKLQEKFDEAAALVVGRLMRDYLETPEVQTRLKTFAIEAIEKAFAGGFSDKLASKITDGLWAP